MNIFDLDAARNCPRRHKSEVRRRTGPVTVILPFFNEAKFIPATLNSLLSQSLLPERIILVDNGSTDDGAALCRAIALGGSEVETIIINVKKPGKIHALKGGQQLISTEFVAFCDADTFYPPHYLEKAVTLIGAAGERCVGALAPGIVPEAKSSRAAVQIAKAVFVGKILAKQCHSGGFGQIFRTRAYRVAGGYDPSIWPFVLEDHEIIHRMLARGTVLYDRDLWCITSPRRVDRRNVSWSFVEQLIYHLTPFRLKNWFFYDFLANRLRNRRLQNSALRVQPWAV